MFRISLSTARSVFGCLVDKIFFEKSSLSARWLKNELALFYCLIAAFFPQSDPLPSWNEGEAKQAILQFVNETTTKGNKNYIPPEDRIATFDQDGTLWVEQPIYTQLAFAIDMIKCLASKHPEWKKREIVPAILANDFEQLVNLSLQEIEKLLAETHSDMTVEEFKHCVQAWLSQAKHPRFDKPYTELVYQPMLEVIQLLKKHGYRVFIVSGGGQEFIRAYAEKVYGIPPEQIIGSAGKVKYEFQNGQPVLVKLPEVLFIDDKKGKPEAINLFIGKHPVASFGNSDGDQQMLEWSQASPSKSFQLLVHHDDPIREYAYDSESKVGTFSSVLMEEAKKEKWIVVSIKNDWKTVFSAKPEIRELDKRKFLKRRYCQMCVLKP